MRLLIPAGPVLYLPGCTDHDVAPAGLFGMSEVEVINIVHD